jgi:zinc transport system substrate-binding protein
MSRISLILPFATALAATAATAELPNVVTDIVPVHALVSRVMEGLGTPSLIVQQGASPHQYSMRPSEAAALQSADLMIWIGPDLTPWLEDAVVNLSSEAQVVTLLEARGTHLLDMRDEAVFAPAQEKEHDHDHAHGAHDTHAWLSPENATVWLDLIAQTLSQADPENASLYAANAQVGIAEIEAATTEIKALLDPVRDRRFVVFHDAYQYFERDFGIAAAGAISMSDAADPGPARLSQIRDAITEQNIACVLAEPQFNPGLVETVLDGTQARTAVLDPLGSNLAMGPALYPQLLRVLATNLSGCLTPEA